MGVYFAVIIVLTVVGLWAKSDGRDSARTLFVWFAFLLLAGVSGLRGYSVGVDTHNYVGLYRHVEYVSTFNGIRFEKGFVWYTRIIRMLSGTDEPHALLVVSSVICVGVFSFFVWSYSKDPLLSFLLYITLQEYFNQMNIMRQALALSFVALAMMILIGRGDARSRRTWLRIVLPPALILFAASFHSSAAIGFLPYLYLIRMDNGYRKEETAKDIAVKITALTAVLFAMHSVLLKILFMLIPSYAGYLDTDWGESNYFGSLLNTAMPFLLLWVGVIVMGRDRLSRKEKAGMLFLGLNILFFALSMKMKVWNRLAQYFSIYLYVLWVPEFCAHVKNDIDRWALKIGIVLTAFASMVVILHFRPEWTEAVPYVTSLGS